MRKHSDTRVRANRWLSMAWLCAIFLICATASMASDRADIVVGMSAALSGPSQDLGIQMKQGIESFFRRVNTKGGIRGRKLVLRARDDGYVPQIAKENMEAFIDDSSIVAVVGNVGTPTARMTLPLANQHKILLFGAYTGSELLRKTPPDRYVINYRASYAQETKTLIRYLLGKGILPYEIAFFIQNDRYGQDIYDGAVKALMEEGFNNPDLISGYYERNTLDIEDAIITILDAPVEPRAFIMAGTYGPCAKFIRIAKKRWPNAIFANVSFVGSSSLRQVLGVEGEGVVISQVVPGLDADLPLVHEFRADLRAYAPGEAPTFISLEGYIVAKLFTEGVKRAGKDINRESIIDGLLEIKNLDIGIQKPITFSPDSHQGCHDVWPTQITKDGFQPLDSAKKGQQKDATERLKTSATRQKDR